VFEYTTSLLREMKDGDENVVFANVICGYAMADSFSSVQRLKLTDGGHEGTQILSRDKSYSYSIDPKKH
jgi:hypothetical protein